MTGQKGNFGIDRENEAISKNKSFCWDVMPSKQGEFGEKSQKNALKMA